MVKLFVLDAQLSQQINLSYVYFQKYVYFLVI